MARTLKIMYTLTILKYYFPKKSPSILLSVEPHLNLGVVRALDRADCITDQKMFWNEFMKSINSTFKQLWC